MRICLFDTRSISLDRLDLPFGKEENERLSSLRNPARARESLGALLALRELMDGAEHVIRRHAEGKPYAAVEFEGSAAGVGASL